MQTETKIGILAVSVVGAWMLFVASAVGTALYIAGRALGVF